MTAQNWLQHCIPCGSWCCRDENPYASAKELSRLGVKEIGVTASGACVFQGVGGQCQVYADRPFECRIFPFDIQQIENRLVWVIWAACPAEPLLNWSQMLDDIEDALLEKWGYDYVCAYVAYHQVHQPEKYSESSFRVLRQLRWQHLQP